MAMALLRLTAMAQTQPSVAVNMVILKPRLGMERKEVTRTLIVVRLKSHQGIMRRKRSITSILNRLVVLVLLLPVLMLCMRSTRRRKTQRMHIGTKLRKRSQPSEQLEPEVLPPMSITRKSMLRKTERKRRRRGARARRRSTTSFNSNQPL